jgi:hypothetical protein
VIARYRRSQMPAKLEFPGLTHAPMPQ